MYPKWLVFVFALLSCLVLMASAAPMPNGDAPPVKRLKQFELRRRGPDDSIAARDGSLVERAERGSPSHNPDPPTKRDGRPRPSNTPAKRDGRPRPSNTPAKRDGRPRPSNTPAKRDGRPRPSNTPTKA